MPPESSQSAAASSAKTIMVCWSSGARVKSKKGEARCSGRSLFVEALGGAGCKYDLRRSVHFTQRLRGQFQSGSGEAGNLMVKSSLTEEDYACCAIKPAGKRKGFRIARGSAFATAKCHIRTVQSINTWMLGTSTCALCILWFFTLGMSCIRQQGCVEES